MIGTTVIGTAAAQQRKSARSNFARQESDKR